MKQLIKLSLLAGVLTVLWLPQQTSASVYGGGEFGNCDYQQDCPPPPADDADETPTTDQPVPADPPKTPTSQSKTSVNLNVTEQSVITNTPFTITANVTTIVGEDGQPVRADNVGWVAFYVDDRLVSTDYSPDANGNYSADWYIDGDSDRIVTAVAYDSAGQVLGRQDTPVTVRLIEQPSDTDQDSGTGSQSDGKSGDGGGWIAKLLGENDGIPGNGVGAVGHLIHHSVPPAVAKSFPYWIFVILLLLVLRLVWQTVRETIANNHMLALLNKQRLIAEEKDNFIALSSHYLHTPLTVMSNGADTMVAVHESTPETLSALTAALGNLKQKIDKILDDVENNTALKNIQAPTFSPAQLKGFSSPFFWLPLVAVAGICLLANFLLGVIGQIDLGINNLWVQVVVFLVVAILFYTFFRTHQLRRRETDKSRQLIDYERTIDTARNSFIQDSTAALRQGLNEVEEAKKPLADSPTKRFVDDGHQRFAEILAKFELLSQIETTSMEADKQDFTLSESVGNVLANYQEAIADKNLTVETNFHNIAVHENRRLFEYVLGTIIDNAVKFSAVNGHVLISADKTSGRLHLKVQDNGQGIPVDKLPHLFKPFSRADSAIQFDYEGLGFSLFLDRIILDHLGGDIKADSQPMQGTLITVTA
ncbi:MAG TPA: ATP-binding protein [Candidatus Saccharimonadales bacterium]|nr:ATP-binding protein [Candidatus Saccharimonadales bacterium]